MTLEPSMMMLVTLLESSNMTVSMFLLCAPIVAMVVDMVELLNAMLGI